MEPISVQYAAIYSTPMVSLDEPLEIQETEFRLILTQGPLSFGYAVPVKSFAPSSVAMTIGERQFSLPGGSYAIIETTADINANSERERVALLVAGVAGLITLRNPHLLHEKVFEGVINTPGHLTIWTEGPITLSASPVTTAAQVAGTLADDIASLANLDAETQRRFQLSSRWFRRGHETVNQVDRFLSWWTVLEIYPRNKNSRVAANIRETLREQVLPRLSMSSLDQHLRIGRIYGERKRIVHEGKAFVDVEDKNFQMCLDRLGAVAAVCLRLLGGLPPGDELQQFIATDSTA